MEPLPSLGQTVAPGRAGAVSSLSAGAAAPPRVATYGALALAVVSVSFSAIFIKLAASPSLVIATNRMLVSLAILAVPTILLGRRQVFALTRADAQAIALSGLFLAIHFGAWTASLAYTSVASSVVFVSTHPVLVALLEWLWLGQRQSRLAWTGILLTLVGTVVIGAHDLQVGEQALFGDGLALLGAVAIVGYLLIGRRLRQRLGFLSYSTSVYAVCWLALLAWTSVVGEDVRAFPPSDLLWFVLLAVFATIGGHTVLNWALRHVPASLVAVTFVGEPVGASILAWLLLGQAVGSTTAIGGAVLLLGIYLTARGS